MRTRRTVGPLSRMSKTLRAHYRAKRRFYGLDRPRFYDEDLLRLFAAAPAAKGWPSAASFLQRIRPEVRRGVARWTGEYQYTIDQVFKDMIRRSRELRLRLHAAGGRHQAGVHDPAHPADHELPQQRPPPGACL